MEERGTKRIAETGRGAEEAYIKKSLQVVKNNEVNYKSA